MASFEIVSPKYGTFTVLLDEEDKHLIDNGHSWAVTISGRGHKRFYVTRHVTGSRTRERLHCLVMKAKGVDHINGDSLDNRKENLRVVAHKHNTQNFGVRYDNKSGYRGVSWSTSRKKWCAYVRLNGVNKNLGRYDHVEEAAKAVKAYRRVMMPFSNEERTSAKA